MSRTPSFASIVCAATLLVAPPSVASAQTARISEDVRSIATYPFDEPNPVPMLTRDARLYPYHSFEGYSATSLPRDWKVVTLENEWIQVFVLPEVGGKVWGAVVKKTGHEFIYRNEVLKFRNIALRGPWTSGGIEFNFGVIGHTPATATPVDYRLVENDDGSVSCWVGGMDLPSRTHWRVEVRLPADKATFETHAFWYNPTPLEQPYYNWMTGAAFARDDLEMTIPGDAYLTHPGDERAWPVDQQGRYLPLYRNNTFEGHKSYHVVGEFNDFFGGYYHDDDYGFGHWARYEDLPGQKLWLWALSREGGVWEDLLTDTDGQYVEFQAGRLFNQYSPGAEVNPITQAGFDPGSSSRWSESWFPLEGTGGLTDASSDGAMHVALEAGRLEVAVNAFRAADGVLEVWSGDDLIAETPASLQPLEPLRFTFDVTAGAPVRVRLAALDLDYRSDPTDRLLARPFATDPAAVPAIPRVDRDVFEARELMKGRWYGQARPLLASALEAEPWHRDALLAAGELAYRRAQYQEGLVHVNRVLQLDAYHAHANFLAGTLYRALGRTADARDAFGWAARSTAFRSAAYAHLAEIMIGEESPREAIRYARLALDYDRYSMPGWRALAVAARLAGDGVTVIEATGELRGLDPLAHAALAEEYLHDPSPASAEALAASLGGEYPDQTVLEAAVWYAHLGRTGDALALLDLPGGPPAGPEARAWKAYLTGRPDLLADPGSPAFQFPYRTESLPVLAWADDHSDAWLWTYLRALDLWALDRAEEAATLLAGLGDAPEFAPLYVARAHLLEDVRGADPVPDLRRAVALDPGIRLLHVELIRELQERGVWTDALVATATARTRFPDDFNLALLEVRTLLNVGRAQDAAAILVGITVLPSESGRESHRLWEWAHTLVALDALEASDADGARTHLMQALAWPESLGQGRPYEPEERLVRWILGVAESRLGNADTADGHFRYVMDATRAAMAGGAGSRLDALAVAAATASGSALPANARRTTTEADFRDLEGRILQRALSLATAPLYRAPALSSTVDGVVWEAGDWTPWLAAGDKGTSWGNHRAVVEVPAEWVGGAGSDSGARSGAPTQAVFVTIPWRRHDPDPGAKSVVVLDAATGDVVANALATRVEHASGDVVFQPNPGSTVYHLYYMPWESSGGYYPTITYADLAPRPSAAWAAAVAAANHAGLPRATTTRIQSVNAFHSFFPMEVIATPAEEAAFMNGSPGGWRAVPEYRDRPVRMKHFLPRHWVADDPGASFASPVLRDENFTVQVALVPGDEPLDDVRVTFDGFPDTWADAWTCFNCGGIDENGEPFQKTVAVPAGAVQPIWLGVRIPADQRAGAVEGTITFATANRGSQAVAVTLDVGDAVAVNHGEDEPDLMTRLAWLNSPVGEDPDAVLAPFEPVTVDGRVLSILGRRVELGALGLPDAIESFFTPELTGFSDSAEPILAAPLSLDVTVGGAPVAFRTGDLSFPRATPGRAEWRATSTADGFTLTVDGALEYDGMLDVRMTLAATADVAVDDIAFPVRYAPGAADYMLGLGRMGGRRPSSLAWKWAVENHQEGVWLGGVNRGLQYVLRDAHYVRPLNTNFYRNQPLNMPTSWFNDGRGGITLSEEGGAVVARNYSGPRTMKAGETLDFQVRFLITPFKPIDTRAHFNTRFVHQYVPVDSVAAWGGTVVNIHHANEINPYINYPFFNLEAQSAYIEEAHAKGIKVKLYDTIRELTYKAHELFALRSLGDEILNDGEGGGHSWMQEHLEDGYHSAWHAYTVDDAAMLDKGTSRWTNYYVEGLGWLGRNQHIDGLYLDDIAFSRATVKRMVNVLQDARDEVVIDLHSANQFNVRDGFINSAMLYMEHFPYISRLWFGEYFDYGQDPDYWMTEVSGLPFGLMGEMLQDGGHPYRGMLYGMTARKYGDVDPRPVWGMMNDFGIAEARMLGYWLADAPVRTGNDRVVATTYVRDGKVLIALASWSDGDEVVSLALDRDALGLAPEAAAVAPAVAGLQEGGAVDLGAVRVPANQGLWVVVG